MAIEIMNNLFISNLIDAFNESKKPDANKNLSILDEDVFFKKVYKHKYVFMTDSGTNLKDFIAVDVLLDSIEFIEDNLNCGKKVIVHCKMGRNRSAFIICGYLMLKKKMMF